MTRVRFNFFEQRLMDKLVVDLSEIILYAQNVGALVRFYRDVLGLHLIYPDDSSDPSGWEWASFEVGALRLSLHGGGQGRIGKDAPELVFTTSDVHQAREHLLQRGLTVSEAYEAAPGVWVCDTQDPEGNSFSLEQAT